MAIEGIRLDALSHQFGKAIKPTPQIGEPRCQGDPGSNSGKNHASGSKLLSQQIQIRRGKHRWFHIRPPLRILLRHQSRTPAERIRTNSARQLGVLGPILAATKTGDEIPLYLDFHTNLTPSSEIRGQITAVVEAGAAPLVLLSPAGWLVRASRP